jgi:DNA-binding beta-propeller fold protein YncE
MKAKVAGFVLICFAITLLSSCHGFFQPDDNTTTPGGGGGGTPGSTTARFVYVANSQNGSISGFNVSTSGALSSITGSPFVGTTQPVDVAVTPAGDILFVADQQQGTWLFGINRNDGSLPSSGSSLLPAQATAPIGVAATASFAYSMEQGSTSLGVPGTVQPFTISNGTIVPINGTIQGLAANPHTMRIDPSGKFLYVAGDASGTWIFSIQQSGLLPGTLLKVGQIATTTGTVSDDVAINPTTTFAYVANGSTGVETYSIATTGNLTRVGSVTAAGTTPIRLAVTPNGKFLYVVNQGSNNISQYSISGNALTSLGTIATGSGPSAIAIDPSSAFVYVTNFTDGTLSVYSIGSTGALAASGTTNVGAGPNAVVVSK